MEAQGKRHMGTAHMKLLRKAEVSEMVGLSYPTIWRWVRDGKFPAPRTIGATNDKDGEVRWLQSEVEAWVESLPMRAYSLAKAQLRIRAKLPEISRNEKK
jgi:prophage regulatory protein